MDPHQLIAIAHGSHPVAAPLGDDSVRDLLDRALRRGDERVLDLGCGQAAWLNRALADHPGVRGEGVDISAQAIDRARGLLAQAGLSDRVVLHAQDAQDFTAATRFDVVLSIGASHAFGGLLPTLAAVRQHLAPGGSVLLGETFWEREPDQAILDFGFAADECDDLATTIDRVMSDGWIPVHGHVSTVEEWDDYEWSWTGALADWALDNPEHPGAGEALKAADDHRRAWLHGYRGTLGFLTLLLRRAP